MKKAIPKNLQTPFHACAPMVVSLGLVFLAFVTWVIPDLSWSQHSHATITDKDITVAIESRFLVEKSIPVNFMNVKTENGIVTLSGTVDNLLAKDRAVNIVESVRGVRAIIDLVVVEPLLQPDDEILKKNSEKCAGG